MLRRFRRVVLVASVAISTFAFAPTVLASTGGACINGGGTHHWATVIKDTASTINGVYSQVHTASGFFFHCTTAGSHDDGSQAWVALEPGTGSSHWADTNAILQIGVINCDENASQCDGTPHLVWASGGCNLHTPTYHDLGSTSYGTHSYEIATVGSSFVLYADGSAKKYIGYSDASINCWSGDDKRFEVGAERWDAGDSSGANGNTSQRLQFNFIQYFTSTWFNAGTITCNNTRQSGIGAYTCPTGSGGSTYGSYLHVWTTY